VNLKNKFELFLLNLSYFFLVIRQLNRRLIRSIRAPASPAREIDRNINLRHEIRLTSGFFQGEYNLLPAGYRLSFTMHRITNNRRRLECAFSGRRMARNCVCTAIIFITRNAPCHRARVAFRHSRGLI